MKLIAVAELTRQECVKSQEMIMLLTRKRSAKVKCRLAYNGNNPRDWISKENKLSPTVGTDSFMIKFTIGTYEGRDIINSDLPNAFIQTNAPVTEVGDGMIT